MVCPRCGRAQMQDVGHDSLPWWRLALSLASFVALIVIAIWSQALEPADGTSTASPADAAFARTLTYASFALIIVGNVLLWAGQGARLRCPVCGFERRVSKRQLEYVDRDERYDQMRRGATPMERVGLAFERYGSWTSDVGPTPSEQGRRSRGFYRGLGVLVTVLGVPLLLLIVFAFVMALR